MHKVKVPAKGGAKKASAAAARAAANRMLADNRQARHQYEILETLAQTCKPKRMTVLGDWWVRGGIRTEVECTYTAT